MAGQVYLTYLSVTGPPTKDQDPLPWGWRTERAAVDGNGYFESSVPVVATSMSVWFSGDHLTPEIDWIFVSSGRFRLTSSFRSGRPVSAVMLTYLRVNRSAGVVWTRPTRKTVTEINADRDRMLDVRGVD
jgi:hypothetical protein